MRIIARHRLIYMMIFIAVACNRPMQRTTYLLSRSERTGPAPAQEKDQSLISTIYARANAAVLRDTQSIFRIPLTEDLDVTVKVNDHQLSDSSVFCTGYILEDSSGSVFLTSTHNILSGRIIFRKQQYRILYVGNELYQVARLDPAKLIDASDDADMPVIDTVNAQKFACNDPARSIDIMVVYTADAETGAGGAAGIKSLIDQSVNLTNVSYATSSVSQRIRLVHTERVAYTESGSSTTDRDRLQSTADGQLDNVHALRQLYKADIVVLIVEKLQPGVCGQAFIQEVVSTAFASHAFAVVKRECAADNLSFAHELGHIMGCRHENDSQLTPYPWGHGYEQAGYQTIMSRVVGSIRTTNFSNPGKSFPNGLATGLTGVAENWLVLNATAPTVSKFICATP